MGADALTEVTTRCLDDYFGTRYPKRHAALSRKAAPRLSARHREEEASSRSVLLHLLDPQ